MPILRYVVFRSIRGPYDYNNFDVTISDPYENPSVRACDQLLHETLCQIFRERCRTRGQIKQLLRAPVKRTHKKSIFKQILRRQPAFGQLFRRRNNLSLLWFSILNYYQKSAELLVRSGADVNEPYGFNNFELTRNTTILHTLIWMYPSTWNTRFIRLVIDHGADLEAKRPDLSTPLRLAVRNGRVKDAEILLEKGADVNALDGSCRIVHEAACGPDVKEAVPLLMKYGAHVTTRDVNGWNLLFFLAANDCGKDVSDLARLLIEKRVSPRELMGSEKSQPIHKAVSRNNLELINLYLDHGANVNALTYQVPPLFIAAKECDQPAVLTTLLRRGANIDLRRGDGLTALHAVTLQQRVDFSDPNTVEKIKILLSVGMDMFDEVDGWTPFEIIVRRKNAENPSIRLMLETLALKRACLPASTELKGEKIVEEYPEAWQYYRDCLEELDRMKATRFVMIGTLFKLLTKCHCQTIALMRYRDFQRNFESEMALRRYPNYRDKMFQAFGRAQHHYQRVLEREKLIDEVIDVALPYIVTRKVAGYTLSCEICEMQKIVNDSKQ